MASSRSATFRKAGLLILLLAAAIVVLLQYMPREEPAEIAAPTKKQAPAPQPVPPRQEQAPRQEEPAPGFPQPGRSPAKPTPPPDYKKPPATVFVSRSPSDAAAPAAPATPDQPNSQPAPAGQSGSEPPLARPMPSGPITLKVSRYVRHWIARHDKNGDGAIDADEWKTMAGAPASIDYNADGVITVEELSAYWADFGRNRRMRLTGSMVEAVAETSSWIPTAEQEARAAAEQAAEETAAKAAEETAGQASGEDSVLPVALADDAEDSAAAAAAAAEDPQQPVPVEEPASPPTARRFVTPKNRLAGLPDWFLARDANGDGQLTVAEFAPNGAAQRLAEFQRLDRNGDGVLTPEECRR